MSFKSNTNQESHAEHRAADEAALELVRAYAMGELPEAQVAEVERLIALRPELQSELETYLEFTTEAAESIARSMPRPRAALRQNVLQAISAGVKAKAHIVLKEEDSWTNIGLEGISMKVLYQDPVTKRYTVLARLDPGTTYPEHKHVGAEECYVIEGDLHVNEISLKAGDYIVNDDGAHHERTWTESGCLLLLNSLLEDQFV